MLLKLRLEYFPYHFLKIVLDRKQLINIEILMVNAGATYTNEAGFKIMQHAKVNFHS